MPRQVDVYYDGWGEHWRWGSLVTTTALNGRPLIAFEYSDEAKTRYPDTAMPILQTSGRVGGGCY